MEGRSCVVHGSAVLVMYVFKVSGAWLHCNVHTENGVNSGNRAGAGSARPCIQWLWGLNVA